MKNLSYLRMISIIDVVSMSNRLLKCEICYETLNI